MNEEKQKKAELIQEFLKERNEAKNSYIFQSETQRFSSKSPENIIKNKQKVNLWC